MSNVAAQNISGVRALKLSTTKYGIKERIPAFSCEMLPLCKQEHIIESIFYSWFTPSSTVFLLECDCAEHIQNSAFNSSHTVFEVVHTFLWTVSHVGFSKIYWNKWNNRCPFTELESLRDQSLLVLLQRKHNISSSGFGLFIPPSASLYPKLQHVQMCLHWLSS